MSTFPYFQAHFPEPATLQSLLDPSCDSVSTNLFASMLTPTSVKCSLFFTSYKTITLNSSSINTSPTAFQVNMYRFASLSFTAVSGPILWLFHDLFSLSSLDAHLIVSNKNVAMNIHLVPFRKYFCFDTCLGLDSNSIKHYIHLLSFCFFVFKQSESTYSCTNSE